MPTEAIWKAWLPRFYNLRRDKQGSHERPDKPVFLITVLDLFDRGILSHNQVPFSAELVKTFERYFEVVCGHDDPLSIDSPYYHLAGDGFWQILAKSGNRPISYEADCNRPPPMRVLRESYGRFEDGLWSAIVTVSKFRRQLREALISRYFPEHREQLEALVGRQNVPVAAQCEDAPGREAAFRRTILEIYDYRCAACRIRAKVSEDISLVEAAHLIPFEISRSDRPDNGIALCPNHRWAMEHFLIAPCPSSDADKPAGVWRVRGGFDSETGGQNDLGGLAGKPVIPPNETKFLPGEKNLRWREERQQEHHSP